ncbi:hypothetical protein L3X38_044611 [Prunus dulcis]|uniref:Alcohol dehydrogenase-like N-terminal domain-containing protein n=1 Tax=Prunus dulcis TaxID=3755 RepID=A0AAD4UYR0_PRUDU|nr:hypothetical protein L3X38_044611 [Prunus dulcis]
MAARLMDAVAYESYGGGPDGLKHVKVPIPSPKKDEACFDLFSPRKFPFIPAVDVAGEVVEVGQGVEKFKEGDKVVAMLNFINAGGLAEFAIASETFITSARPPEVSAAEGAGLPSSGLTAHQALTKAAGIKLDGTGLLKNILITGASGGVGHSVLSTNPGSFCSF